MNASIQQCNVCKAYNTEKSNTWIRLFGVGLGATLQPIQTIPPRTVDFCPVCAPTITADKLPGFYSATKS